MLVMICLGRVLAIDLRVGALAAAFAGWLRAQAEAGSEARVQTPSGPLRRRDRELAAGSVELIPGAPGRPGTPVPALLGGSGPLPPLLPVEGLDLELPPPVEPEPLAAAAPEPFHREFEGLVVAAPAAEPVAAPMVLAVADEPEKVWALPAAEMLDVVGGKRQRLEQEIRATIGNIESTLAAFGIQARVRGVNSGPTVTQYELQPAKGVPVRKITAHQTDLSLALAAPIRIQAPIPGKAAIGIEVPNKAAQLVTLREVVQSPLFTDPKSRLSVAPGADVSGHPVVGDPARMPHILTAGA